MRKFFQSEKPSTRLVEDLLYERVYEEIDTGQLDKAAQARAMADGGVDESAVRKSYVKHRLARLKAELALKDELLESERAQALTREEARKQAEAAAQESERIRIEKERVEAIAREPLPLLLRIFLGIVLALAAAFVLLLVAVMIFL